MSEIEKLVIIKKNLLFVFRLNVNYILNGNINNFLCSLLD